MKLSVIIPVYNEEHTIVEIINRVKAVNINKEIIVVDDCSTDGTREILKSLSVSNNQIKLYFHETNSGKGSAIRTALQHISGDIVIIQDADLEYDPQDYHNLIEPIINGKGLVVYGSRMLSHNLSNYSHLSFLLGGLFLSWLTNILYKANITDEPTCYKAFRTDVIKDLNLKCKKFEFCPEVTAKILKKGIKICEVPISYNPRKKQEGKKTNWKDGVHAIWTLLKYRLRS
ncbi:MAG TPA: glycosyltransferase family 2 protein [Candidatus Brocadiia bacterium]|nr:glycosyltransferase family 2 protein [Candidatus Brocadiales bacterium]